jgi:hypothetical protein
MSVTQSHGKVSLAKSPKFNPVNGIFACWTIEYQYCYISYLPNLVLSFVLHSDGEASIPTGGAGPTSGGNVLLNRRQNIWQMRGGGGRGVSPARLTRRETFEQTKQAVNRQLRSTEKATTFSSGISKNSWSVLTKCTRYAMYSSYNKWSMPTTEEDSRFHQISISLFCIKHGLIFCTIHHLLV